MNIITLLTDYGWKDAYAAQLKALVLRKAPDARIVDISHEVPRQHIASAGHMLKTCWEEFPEGTVHVVGVASPGSELAQHVIIEHKGHIFIGADNGVFSLVFDEQPDGIFLLDTDYIGSHPMRAIYVPAALRIFQGTAPSELGKPMISLKEIKSFDSYIAGREIHGAVVHIDHFGNAVSNIHKSMFDQMAEGHHYSIATRRLTNQIQNISPDYYQVPQSERLALFNENGFLEIAINHGSAQKLLGCKVDDPIIISFEPYD